MTTTSKPVWGWSKPDGGRRFRQWCVRCRRAEANCYCAMIEPFESKPRFIILIHPREARHRLGTGRMAHRILDNSRLLEGLDFSHHDWLNREIENPANAPMLLFPASDALNLTKLSTVERGSWIPPGRNPVVLVPDGTWKSARKMVRLSVNLSHVPKICFDPPAPSGYGFRREPNPEYLSTIEAIDQVIELFGGDELDPDRVDRLLTPFRSMVAAQLAHARV